MKKHELLKTITFGESIAEQEAKKLKDYFLQTEFWNMLRTGANDIVYGAKGAGKSALYTSIFNDSNAMFDEGILVSMAENPTGSTAFANLKNEPPTTQTEFVRLWKLYFLVIAVQVLDDYEISDSSAEKLKQILVDCNLIPAQNKLASFLKVCKDFLKSFVNGKEVSTTAEFDPATGQYTGQRFSLTFGEPTKTDFDKGLFSIEYVFELLAKSLNSQKIKLWIIIDRLDVAFAENEELEANALRALFKAYLDLAQLDEIKLKIFLRDDIWQNITSNGFREASHITKFQNLSWSKETLLNLFIRRVLDNNDLVQLYEIDKISVLSDFKNQENLFYKLFPLQIDVGAKKPNTIDWILARTKDGKGVNTPRELIQLLSHARLIELKRLESGIDELAGDQIISRQSFKLAIAEVSKQRIEQTIYAEHADLKKFIESLRGDKAEHSLETLRYKWVTTEEIASEISKKLEKIGFFEVRGNFPNQRFKIPFIYRPYLEIIQGSAVVNDG